MSDPRKRNPKPVVTRTHAFFRLVHTPSAQIKTPDQGLDGQSLAAALKNPAAAKDRYAFTITAPNEFSVVNTQWRYIHYADGAEEFYNEKSDSTEWTNLASRPEHRKRMDQMKAAAPAHFAAPGKKRGEMKLVTEGENFHWEDKPAGQPAEGNPKKKK